MNKPYELNVYGINFRAETAKMIESPRIFTAIYGNYLH